MHGATGSPAVRQAVTVLTAVTAVLAISAGAGAIHQGDPVPLLDEGTAGDEFGATVAIHGETALVGAPGAEAGGNEEQGLAYVYTADGGGWSLQATLTAPDGEAGDAFATSVDVHEGTAIVGARQATVDGNASQGAAYVFEAAGGDWAAADATKLVASDGDARHLFGTSVAVHEDTAIVGATGVRGEGGLSQGAAYVYDASRAGWSDAAETQLTADDGDGFDRFGSAVALDGDRALVGAPEASVDGNDEQGAAYVFHPKPDEWSETSQTKLTVDGGADDWFGSAVALDGDALVVGAERTDVGDNVNQGAAHVFVQDGSTQDPVDRGWDEAATLHSTLGQTDARFGAAVAIHGEAVAVGAPQADVGEQQTQGDVHLFAAEEGGWANAEATRITADGGDLFDRFGSAVALHGETLGAGAPDADPGGEDAEGTAYTGTLHLSGEPPSITIDQVGQEGQPLIPGDPIEIQVTAEAGSSALASVEVAVDGEQIASEDVQDPGPAFPLAVEWVPEEPGTYVVTATATDEGGATATDSLDAIVEEPRPYTSFPDDRKTLELGDVTGFHAPQVDGLLYGHTGEALPEGKASEWSDARQELVDLVPPQGSTQEAELYTKQVGPDLLVGLYIPDGELSDGSPWEPGDVKTIHLQLDMTGTGALTEGDARLVFEPIPSQENRELPKGSGVRAATADGVMAIEVLRKTYRDGAFEPATQGEEKQEAGAALMLAQPDRGGVSLEAQIDLQRLAETSADADTALEDMGAYDLALQVDGVPYAVNGAAQKVGDDYAFQTDMTIPPEALDVGVHHVEITQSVQNEENTLPLVEGKDTLVRVFLEHGRPEPVEVEEVYIKVRQRYEDANGEPRTVLKGTLTRDAGLTVPPGSVDRETFAHSANFKLPLDWVEHDQGLELLEVEAYMIESTDPLRYDNGEALSAVVETYDPTIHYVRFMHGADLGPYVGEEVQLSFRSTVAPPEGLSSASEGWHLANIYAEGVADKGPGDMLEVGYGMFNVGDWTLQDAWEVASCQAFSSDDLTIGWVEEDPSSCPGSVAGGEGRAVSPSFEMPEDPRIEFSSWDNASFTGPGTTVYDRALEISLAGEEGWTELTKDFERSGEWVRHGVGRQKPQAVSASADLFRRMMPVADATYIEHPWQSVGVQPSNPDNSHLVREVLRVHAAEYRAMRALLSNAAGGPIELPSLEPMDQLYGFMVEGRGLSDRPMRDGGAGTATAGVGEDEPTTMLHEIAHNIGGWQSGSHVGVVNQTSGGNAEDKETYCGADAEGAYVLDENFPHNHTRVVGWDLDNPKQVGQLLPANYPEILSYCKPWDDGFDGSYEPGQWISDYRWKELVDVFANWEPGDPIHPDFDEFESIQSSGGIGDADAAPDEDGAEPDGDDAPDASTARVITAVIHPNGSADLRPSFEVPGETEMPQREVDDPAAILVVNYRDRDVEIPVNVTFGAQDGDGSPGEHGSDRFTFVRSVPDNGEITGVSLVDASTRKVLDGYEATGFSVEDDELDVPFEFARDERTSLDVGIQADAEDTMHKRLLYNPEGELWFPYGAAFQGEERSVEFGEGIPGTDEGRFRMVISDGVQTEWVDSSSFTVPHEPPEVSIDQADRWTWDRSSAPRAHESEDRVDPATDTTIQNVRRLPATVEVPVGKALSLGAQGLDEMNRVLPPDEMVWRIQDEQGQVVPVNGDAFGERFDHRFALPGTYQVTLTGTDPETGLSDTDEIEVVVNPPVLPTAQDSGTAESPKGSADAPGFGALAAVLAVAGAALVVREGVNR